VEEIDWKQKQDCSCIRCTISGNLSPKE